MNRKKCTGLTDERGFSLIEVMVVLVIIGLIVGLVGPRLVGRVGKAKQKTAKAQIELLCTAVDTFKLDMGRYPKELKELVQQIDDKKWEGPYLPKQLPKDPWDNPYEYKSPGEDGRDYEIISYGADGTSGGEDENMDIYSWKQLGADDDEDEE
jgi:general secretion pathway protein G